MRVGLLLLVVAVATSASPSSWPEWYAWVQKVSANPDPVQRNFQISAGYYKLSLAFAELLGTTEESGAAFAINWPTMAAWASNSVGVSIRKEVPTGWMRSVLSFLPQAVVDFLLKFPQAVAPLFNGLLERTSKALALGNNAVWLDVGTVHARFGLAYGNLTAPDDGAVARFNASLNCAELVCFQMQEAMMWYYDAMWEADPKRKHEKLYVGNALVGQAEQTKLQPFVSGALLHNFTFHFLGFSFVIPAEQLTTYFMISLMMPNEFLLCSHDVPPILGTSQLFPTPLQHLQLPFASQMYFSFTNDTDSVSNTGAQDWNSLSQRLRYIVPLFRRNHQGTGSGSTLVFGAHSAATDAQMVTCPPFTPAQFAAIEAGQSPSTADLCLEANCCPGSARTSKRVAISIV